ncbi:MAG: hypothetical protein SFV15_16720 [Polyangiaceae bacterium]|nr:hypothetical protein [Polyangiaceae bacterium]
MADPAQPTKKRPFLLRPWVRAIHRDAGYLVVGLTFVYALSGLAVNHIADWDPNFHQVAQTHKLPGPFPADDQAAANKVLQALGITEKPTDVYRVSPERLDITLEHRTLHLDTKAQQVLEEGQKPRFFLRLANWLHLNRGKKAWSYVADAYAVILLYLATSGLFMIPGKKGLWGRGLVIALIGASVPVGYVVLSGGP